MHGTFVKSNGLVPSIGASQDIYASSVKNKAKQNKDKLDESLGLISRHMQEQWLELAIKFGRTFVLRWERLSK